MDYATLMMAVMALPVAAAVIMAILPAKATPRPIYETLHVVSLAGVLALAVVLVVGVVGPASPRMRWGIGSTWMRSAASSWRSSARSGS